ncbi:MAG: tetratricopeptide repeat protein, partial [Deltaproteobacteria bacterium]|nr:tetratricopeptide repeat protein [Deltaproteobacteria bacterium]
MDYYHSSIEKKKKTKEPQTRKNRFSLWGIVLVVLVSFVAGAVFSSLAVNLGGFSWLSRMKDTILVTIAGRIPQTYYIDIEKNGKDYRLKEGDRFEISYRDEFAIKKVDTSSPFNRGITVDIEGMGTSNDLEVLLKGIELVDRKIADDSKTSGINVLYRDKITTSIQIDVVITPQDWLRLAKESKTEKSRIEYLERAVSMKKDDINVRKMLAKLYVKSGMTNKGILQYKKILKQEPGDLVSLIELSKIYIRGKQYKKAITIHRKIIKIDPKDDIAYANIAYSYARLGNWDRAVANCNASLKLNPDSTTVRYNLAEAYEKTGRDKDAIAQY